MDFKDNAKEFQGDVNLTVNTFSVMSGLCHHYFFENYINFCRNVPMKITFVENVPNPSGWWLKMRSYI